MIRMQRVEFTVKEYASHEGVDERTVRRWIEKGAVRVRRTPGGRVRIVEHRDESRMVYLTPDGLR